MSRKSRETEIIEAIRKHLIGAVSSLVPITDQRLMSAAGCARATYYKYVTKGSAIEGEIEAARAEQKKYAESKLPLDNGNDLSLRQRLEIAETGNRNLLALLARVTAILTTKYRVRTEIMQAAMSEAMPHPNRSVSHTRKGRRRA